MFQYLYRTDYEDVVSLDTCIALQSIDSNTGPCMLDIKVTNCQKIARIAVVSEANVLEFFKQYGEYENTIFAEFIDEFENNSVYLAETTIQPPSTEASIKVSNYYLYKHLSIKCLINVCYCISLPKQEVKVL